VARLLIVVLTAEGALGLIFYLAPALFVGRGVVGLAGIFAFFGLALTRFVFLQVVDEEIFKRRVLVWGAGSAQQRSPSGCADAPTSAASRSSAMSERPVTGPTLRRASFCSTTEICFAWRCAIKWRRRGRNG